MFGKKRLTVKGMNKRAKMVNDIERKVEWRASSEVAAPKLELTTEVGKIPVQEIERIAKMDVDRAFRKLDGPIRDALDGAMESSAWGWDEGSRDIVETGALKNSLNINWENGSFQISYDQPYAALIYYGGYIYPYGNTSAPKVYIPGRPWIEYTLVGGGPINPIPWQQIINTYLS